MEIEILNEARLRAWCQRIQMPEAGTNALADMAKIVCQNETLSQIFTAYYEKTAVRGEWHRNWEPLPMDPKVTGVLGEQDSLFYLLAFMAALPHAEGTYRRMGIPQAIFDETMTDITFYTRKAFDVHGHWMFNQFAWIWRHLACELFRLGRMQYMLSTYEGHARAFRHRESGKIRLLCGSEIVLRPDGYAQGAGKRPIGGEQAAETQDKQEAEEPGAWFAIFEESEAGWRGNPITPLGQAQRETVLLPRGQWDCILQKGDTILDLHIPRAKSLTIEDCRESFRQAFAFFPRYFPERPFKAVFCHTWLFSPQLEQFVGPESNIVRFQREFYLYPHAGGPEFLWGFVFGPKYKDPGTAPRDTTLRRVVLDWLEGGKEIFDLPGLMFHSPDEWGSQPYWS